MGLRVDFTMEGTSRDAIDIEEETNPRGPTPTVLNDTTFAVADHDAFLILRFGNRGADSSQSSGKVKAVQLWDKSKDDLTKQLGELKTELGQLRIQQVASSGSKLNKM